MDSTPIRRATYRRLSRTTAPSELTPIMTAVTNLATGNTTVLRPDSSRSATPGTTKSIDDTRIRVLTIRQVANIVFNENRDVQPGESTPEQLQEAKVAQAHAIINADRRWGKHREKYAPTAAKTIRHKLTGSTQYKQALEAARTAYKEANRGIDPTGGRCFYNNRFEGDNLKGPRFNKGHTQWQSILLIAVLIAGSVKTQELTQHQTTEMVQCALRGGGGWVQPSLYSDGKISFSYTIEPSEDQGSRDVYVAFWNPTRIEGTLLVFNLSRTSKQQNRFILVNEGKLLIYKGQLDVRDLLGGMGVYRHARALLLKLKNRPLVVLPADQGTPDPAVCRTPPDLGDLDK
jgi:hypothetical protein